MKRLLVQIKEDDYDWLKKQANEKGSSMSKMIRDLVTLSRDKNERKQSPKQY
jgi:hypothetical protein